jgi:O-antigen ligase
MQPKNISVVWKRRSRTSLGSVLALGAAVVFATLFASFAIIMLPWFFVIPIAIIPIGLAITFAYPEVAVAILLAAVFGVIPGFVLPSIPLLGGRIRPEDLGIIAFFFILLVRHAGRVGPSLVLIRPYLLPLGSLLVVAAISAVYALMLKKTPARDIFNEIRPFYYWLILPLLPLAVDSEARLNRFLRLLLILALLLAAGMLIQSVAGVRLFQGARVMGLTTVDETFGGIIRSTSPGEIFMHGAFVYLCAAYAMRRPIPVWLLILAGGLLAGGIIVGFTRGMWISVIIGLGLLALYSKQPRYLSLAAVLVTAGVIGVSVLSVTNPRYLDAVTERVTKIDAEIKSGSSFGRRKIEMDYAIPKIVDHPFAGVGLGGQYKPHTLEAFGWEGETRYIHTLYVALATKLGLPGLICAVWFVSFALWRSWRITRMPARDPAITFTALWTLLTATVITSVTQPNLVSTSGVATVALAIFLMETQVVREAPGSLVISCGIQHSK